MIPCATSCVRARRICAKASTPCAEWCMGRWDTTVRLGDVFIFVNGRRDTMKLLHAEDGGLVLYIKRLEEGIFRLPAYDVKSHSYPMEWRDLVMMVEGMQDNPNERLKRLKAVRKEYSH